MGGGAVVSGEGVAQKRVQWPREVCRGTLPSAHLIADRNHIAETQ